MTDITALMATMKAAAEKAKHAGEALVMHFDERISALNAFQLAACPTNVLALVEALEHYKSREERVTKLVLGNSVSWEELFKQIEEAKQRIASLESRIVTVKLPEDRADSDVSSRNQPGMVVAVHIDAGDFVKVYGQVFEVEETDFDDHDVTLWFVGGNALRCAAGCQVEVVAVPDAVGIQVIEGEGQ